MKLSPLRGVVIGIALLSLIFITISLSTNYWFVNKNSDTFNGGIWEGCTKIVVSLNVSGVVRTSSGKLDCRKLQVKGWLKATRAFMILAVISFVAVGVGFVLSIVREMTMKISAAILLAPFILTTTGLAIAMGENPYKAAPQIGYGYSVILGWVGAVLLLMASIMSFFIE